MSGMLLRSECLATMKQLPDACMDSIVTDPPYGLEFMGKDWDAPWQVSSKSKLFGDRERPMPGWSNTRNANCQTCGGRMRGAKKCSCDTPNWDEAPNVTYLRQMAGFQDWFHEIAEEMFRILKPGGHLLAFGGTRTYHRMACAIEDAGFEIRDSIHWIYGSGFPKSLDVSKAIDKAAGHWRGKAGAVATENGSMAGANYERTEKGDPITDAAREWSGWGTALKPAHEPVVVARKPLVGTVAKNVLEYGTGALNIDGCRVKYNPDEVDFSKTQRQQNSEGAIEGAFGASSLIGKEIPTYKPEGRWPANIIHDGSDEVLESFPTTAPSKAGGKSGTTFASGAARNDVRVGHNDNGGSASRYFYQAEPDLGPPFYYSAKASKKEKNAGLDSLPKQQGGSYEGRADGSLGKQTNPAANIHPTVKPVALMRYLIRLVTPPNGVVFDPFLGSGTTAVAAILEGYHWAGCEMTEDYWPIIEARTEWAKSQC